MSSNFFNRIITSIFLLFFLSISLFINSFIWLFSLIIISFISYIEFNSLSKKIWKKNNNIFFLINIISVFYLICFTWIAYESYEKPPIEILFIILICIFSDTGGYIFGKLIGGKKLSKISPNKTISGTIGSFLLSLLPIVIFMLIHDFTGNEIFSFKSLKSMFLLCLILSFICQLGDLFISYFKRKAKVKDTGNILPGHGGLLDRIDGMIFVLPAAFIINKIIY